MDPDVAQAHFDRELRAVAASPGKLESYAHLPDSGRLEVVLPVRQVSIAGGLGQKHLNRLADEFVALVSEHLLGSGIGKNNPAEPVGRYDCLPRRFKQRPGEFFVCLQVPLQVLACGRAIS
jgi:hypothetical protein